MIFFLTGADKTGAKIDMCTFMKIPRILEDSSRIQVI